MEESAAPSSGRSKQHDNAAPSKVRKSGAIYRPPGQSLITFVRGWVAFVGMIALANTAQCYVKPDFVWERLYNAPDAGATRLAARTYGMWTLLAATVRFTYSINPYNWELFIVTLVSFFIAFGHCLTELLIYQSGLLDIGMISPLVVRKIN